MATVTVLGASASRLQSHANDSIIRGPNSTLDTSLQGHSGLDRRNISSFAGRCGGPTQNLLASEWTITCSATTKDCDPEVCGSSRMYLGLERARRANESSPVTVDNLSHMPNMFDGSSLHWNMELKILNHCLAASKCDALSLAGMR